MHRITSRTGSGPVGRPCAVSPASARKETIASPTTPTIGGTGAATAAAGGPGPRAARPPRRSATARSTPGSGDPVTRERRTRNRRRSASMTCACRRPRPRRPGRRRRGRRPGRRPRARGSGRPPRRAPPAPAGRARLGRRHDPARCRRRRPRPNAAARPWPRSQRPRGRRPAAAPDRGSSSRSCWGRRSPAAAGSGCGAHAADGASDEGSSNHPPDGVDRVGDLGGLRRVRDDRPRLSLPAVGGVVVRLRQPSGGRRPRALVPSVRDRRDDRRRAAHRAGLLRHGERREHDVLVPRGAPPRHDPRDLRHLQRRHGSVRARPDGSASPPRAGARRRARAVDRAAHRRRRRTRARSPADARDPRPWRACPPGARRAGPRTRDGGSAHARGVDGRARPRRGAAVTLPAAAVDARGGRDRRRRDRRGSDLPRRIGRWLGRPAPADLADHVAARRTRSCSSRSACWPRLGSSDGPGRERRAPLRRRHLHVSGSDRVRRSTPSTS